MSTELVPASAPEMGVIAREDFGSKELARTAETAAAAVAAQAKAAVEARYIMALRQPRDIDMVRERLLKECKRPGFAQVAWYALPGKKDAQGLSIRFAEAALRCLGNVYPEALIVYESPMERIVQVSVTDLEANVTYSTQVVFEKSVERRNPEGRVVLGERKNSAGDTVYRVLATEDELLAKHNALVSKAVRTNGLRLLPGDLEDECRALILKTRRNAAAEDPDKAKKALMDAFTEKQVSPADLKLYLGHSLERISTDELLDLQGLYRAIRDEGKTWDEIMEARGITGSRELQEEIAERKLASLRGQKPVEEAPASDAQPEPPPEAPKPKAASRLKFGGAS